jgi:sugar (pentulose or hexulose) kinase
LGCFLGIDAGTTSIKAALFDPSGQQVALARKEYILETPAPNRVELDPEVYWQACCQVVRQALGECQVRPDEVDSLCISSQGETFIPVDLNGKPTHKAIVWLDNRAAVQAEKITARFGVETVYRRTGQPEIAPTWPACKILWLREESPDVFAQTGRYLLLEDYLLHRLTGQYVTEHGLQTSSLFLDLTTGQWWPEMFEFVGITPSHLGSLVKPGTAIGHLSRVGAEDLGLTARTLAVTGSMDQSIGAIGSGNVASGMATESTGGALGIVSTLSHPVFDPLGKLPCYYHARPDHYALLPWGQTAGMALRWFRDQFFAIEAGAAADAGLDAYDLMTAAASHIAAGSEGLVVLPHLEGAACPEFNRNARAVFFGATLRHTRAHFVRAILESVAYMLRKNLEIVEKVGGPMREIRSTGGGARSRLWLQIKADVLQKPITRVNVEEAACLGAAMLGAVASGYYPSLDEASEAMVRVREHLEPDPANAEIYSQGYSRYIELYDRLEPMFC